MAPASTPGRGGPARPGRPATTGITSQLGSIHAWLAWAPEPELRQTREGPAMPAAQARVGTERASRYLAQLCQHVTSTSAKGPAIPRHRRRHAPHGAPPPGTSPRAEWTETHGTISFPGGTITLQATPDPLIVRACAGTGPDLERIQERVGGHLARFGRRDQLTVTWHRLDPPA